MCLTEHCVFSVFPVECVVFWSILRLFFEQLWFYSNFSSKVQTLLEVVKVTFQNAAVSFIGRTLLNRRNLTCMERAYYHIGVRTLNARRMFREIWMCISGLRMAGWCCCKQLEPQLASQQARQQASQRASAAATSSQSPACPPPVQPGSQPASQQASQPGSQAASQPAGCLQPVKISQS